jgi:hypothetical protein
MVGSFIIYHLFKPICFKFGFSVFYEQLFSDALPSLYTMVLGLPITAYVICYVLQVAPMRQVSKTNKVLGLLFFGIVGM